MPSCILHVGMPKTGTSSIQESLLFGLSDPRFRYISFGDPNAGEFLESLFGDETPGFWVHQRLGYTRQRVMALGDRYGVRLRQALRRARAAGVTPIISAEHCWRAHPSLLGRLADFLRDERFDVRVVAYMRPFRPWFESNAQQMIKLGEQSIDFSRLAEQIRERDNHGLARRLGEFERLFGRESVLVRRYPGDGAEGGCVVRDFCTCLGLRLEGAAIVRTNDSICADAVRMLHCFNRFGCGTPGIPLPANQMLVMRLQELHGGPFRLHPSVFAPLAAEIAIQEREIAERYGVDLRGGQRDSVESDGIRGESDMYLISQASLDWLARASGQATLVAGAGEAGARMVAQQVAWLAAHPLPELRLRYFRQRLRLKWRWLTRGD